MNVVHSIDLKKNIFATTFPINLIEFGQNEILLVSHYNRSEAGLASVQTGNKCLYLYFILLLKERKVKIKQF